MLRAPPISVSGECPDTNLCPTGPVISGFLPQKPKNPVRLVTISCPGRLMGGALTGLDRLLCCLLGPVAGTMQLGSDHVGERATTLAARKPRLVRCICEPVRGVCVCVGVCVCLHVCASGRDTLTLSHTYARTHTHTRTRTSRNINIHTHAHTRTHTHTHARAHTYRARWRSAEGRASILIETECCRSAPVSSPHQPHSHRPCSSHSLSLRE